MCLDLTNKKQVNNIILLYKRLIWVKNYKITFSCLYYNMKIAYHTACIKLLYYNMQYLDKVYNAFFLQVHSFTFEKVFRQVYPL